MYLIRLEEQSPVNGKSVKELSQIYSTLQVRIVAILRHGVTVIPHSDTVFEAGDMAYIISKANQIDTVKHLAGGNDFDIKNVMIAGGGRIGRYAAMTLEDKKRITLVEQDRKRCEDLSGILSNSLIINGDATDIELLKEEGLANNDAFIAVTDSSETNVLTCLHARRFGIKKTIALVENTGFINISQDIGIDTIINKKLIASSHIFQIMLDNDASTARCLALADAEVAELVVKDGSKVTKAEIRDLKLPSGMTIAG